MGNKPFNLSDLPPKYREQALSQLEPERVGIPTAIKKRKQGRPEGELQDEIIAHLQTHGFLVVHFRAAKTEKGWRTPVEGDGEGFPDVVAVGHGRVVVIEVKSAVGKVDEAQYEWLREFQKVPGCTALVATPESWPHIKGSL